MTKNKIAAFLGTGIAAVALGIVSLAQPVQAASFSGVSSSITKQINAANNGWGNGQWQGGNTAARRVWEQHQRQYNHRRGTENWKGHTNNGWHKGWTKNKNHRDEHRNWHRGDRDHDRDDRNRNHGDRDHDRDDHNTHHRDHDRR